MKANFISFSLRWLTRRQLRPTYLSGHSKPHADRRQGKSAVCSFTRTSLLSWLTLWKALSDPYLVLRGEGMGPWRSKVLSIQVVKRATQWRSAWVARPRPEFNPPRHGKEDKVLTQRKASSFLRHSRFKRLQELHCSKWRKSYFTKPTGMQVPSRTLQIFITEKLIYNRAHIRVLLMTISD